MAISGMREAVAAVRHYQARVTDMQYPQSLGELCLELAQRKLFSPMVREVTESSNGGWIHRTTYYGLPFNPDVRGEMDALRRAMWHKERT